MQVLGLTYKIPILALHRYSWLDMTGMLYYIHSGLLVSVAEIVASEGKASAPTEDAEEAFVMGCVAHAMFILVLAFGHNV